MNHAPFFAAAVILFTGTANAAIYKCQVDGKTVFSQTPCAADAEEYQVDYIRQNAENAKAMTEQNERIRESTNASLTEMEIRRLGREIKSEEANIRVLQKRRDGELAALRQKKSRANNNLAGAVWEQSISDEMNAVNKRYDAQISERQTNIQRMLDQVDRLSRQ
ncbi:MAG: hypothetical protein R6X15_05255 [Pseudomonadota bacterium]